MERRVVGLALVFVVCKWGKYMLNKNFFIILCLVFTCLPTRGCGMESEVDASYHFGEIKNLFKNGLETPTLTLKDLAFHYQSILSCQKDLRGGEVVEELAKLACENASKFSFNFLELLKLYGDSQNYQELSGWCNNLQSESEDSTDFDGEVLGVPNIDGGKVENIPVYKVEIQGAQSQANDVNDGESDQGCPSCGDIFMLICGE